MSAKGHKLTSPRFTQWLEQQGCSLVPVTSEYEVSRFECGHGIGVVYRGKKGHSTSSEWAAQAVDCYLTDKPWNSGVKKVKRGSGNDKRKMRLMDRDGSECFFCGRPFASHHLTKEHLLSLSQGGPDTLANMVLACQPCNTEADSMPLHKKVQFRDDKRKTIKYQGKK